MEPEERLETCLQQDATFDSIPLILLPNSQTSFFLMKIQMNKVVVVVLYMEISYETIYFKLYEVIS